LSNIPKLYAFSFLKMALFPMAIITLFWKDHIGLSLTQILLLQGIFSVATLLFEYPSGYISDRLGYRFSLCLASVLGIAGWAVYTVAGSFAQVLVAEILLGISYAFISGSDTALLFESLRREGKEEHYARYDGRMTGVAQAGEAAGAVFAGVMYAAAPLLPFLVQIGVWVLGLAISFSLTEAEPEKKQATRSHLAEALTVAGQALVKDDKLRDNIFFAAVLGIASYYPVWLIQPYMQQSGVPLPWFGPVWAGANLTIVLFSLLCHRMHFHLRDRGISLLFLLLIATGYLGLGLYGGVFGFLFYYLLTAMRGLQGPLLRTYLQQGSTRANRASILSLKSLVFRLLFVATGPLVGWIADRAGLQNAFLILSVVLILALVPLRKRFLRSRRVV
jgi:MFS family permease